MMLKTSKMKIKLKSLDYNLIDKAVKTIVTTVKKTNSIVSNVIPLRTTKDKEYIRLMEIQIVDEDSVMALINLDLPKTVEIEIKL